MPISGQCRCGETTYELVLDAVPAIYACHCLDCQTWSGSAFSEHALLQDDALSCNGPLAIYVHTNHDRIESEQVVCGSCYTRMYNRNGAVPGMIILRAGTLSASNTLSPIAHIWTKRKQPWLVLPDDVPCWEETPTPQEFGAALQKAGKANDASQA